MRDFDELKKSAEAGVPASPNPDKELTPAEYLAEMKDQFRREKHRRAYDLSKVAVAKYPHDPLIHSYYGYLQAIVDIKYRTGIETCKRALALLGKKAMYGEGEVFAAIYLDLGRIYLAAGMKPDAIETFRKGLKFDSHNSALLQELRGMGERKEAPIAFLQRSHPLNKYIGKVLNKPGKHGGGPRSRGHGPR